MRSEPPALKNSAIAKVFNSVDLVEEIARRTNLQDSAANDWPALCRVNRAFSAAAHRPTVIKIILPILKNFKTRRLDIPDKNPPSACNSLAFLPTDKHRILSVGDGKLWLWDLRKKPGPDKPIKFDLGKTPPSVAHAVPAPSGTHIAVGMRDPSQSKYELRILPLEDSSKEFFFRGHNSAISAIIFLNTMQLASSAFDNTVCLWDTRQTSETGRLENPGAVNCLVYAGDGTHIASAARDATVKIWDTRKTDSPVKLLHNTFNINALAFSLTGKHLAAGSQDGSIHMWDLSQPTPSKTPFAKYPRAISNMAFAPDNRWFASTTHDNLVNISENWSDKHQKKMALPNGNTYGHSCYLHCQYHLPIAFSPDGARLVIGNSSSNLGLWSPKIMPLLKRTQNHK